MEQKNPIKVSAVTKYPSGFKEWIILFTTTASSRQAEHNH